MPLYAYRCTQCGHRFEKIQSFSAEPEKLCPKCGGVVERPLTAPGLQFKGAGWYVNDYAPKSSSRGADSAAPETKADTKSEAKPDSKSGATSPANSETKSSTGGDSGGAGPTTSTPAATPGPTTN